jgi:hypothetical protein
VLGPECPNKAMGMIRDGRSERSITALVNSDGESKRLQTWKNRYCVDIFSTLLALVGYQNRGMHYSRSSDGLCNKHMGELPQARCIKLSGPSASVQ